MLFMSFIHEDDDYLAVVVHRGGLGHDGKLCVGRERRVIGAERIVGICRLSEEAITTHLVRDMQPRSRACSWTL